MRILLDITRSVARARLPAATGIDRVERAWIGRALCRPPGAALFLARVGATQHLVGGDDVRRLLDWLDGEGPAPARDLRALNPLRDPRLARAQALVRRAGTDRAPAGDAAQIAAMLRRAGLGAGWAYVNTGHDNLSPAVIGGTGAAGLARAVLVHDVIPLEHPGFARPGTPERFRARLDAALGADLLLCNSADTAARLARLAGRALPPVVVTPLGVEMPRPGSAAGAAAGGFVCLGTIEPRKNHALLLEVWARLWQARGPDSPRLDIVGRRGWSNEAVFRTLDTAPFMGRSVIEHGPLDDARAAALLAGARALLFPSFAEGFGLPLAEALALGVPVIAADLPALGEVGGAVPEFLSPHDPAAWLRAVGDYAAEPSPRRAAQTARLAGWQPPGWEAHFRAAENALETILVQTARGG